jgi:hypothetical protein
MKNFRRFGRGTVLLALALIALTVAISFKIALGYYLRSDGFRQRIEVAVGRTLKAQGTLMPLHFADSTFYSDGFAARGGNGAFFSDLRADQIRAAINWRALFGRTCQIDELTVQRLDIQFADRSATPLAQPVESQPSNTPSSWRVDLRQASVFESSWRWGTNTPSPGQVTGAAFVLKPGGDDSWLIDASSGKVSQGGWPELSIESAKLRYTRDALFVTESTLHTGAGRIVASGEVNFNQAADLQAQIISIPLDPLLPPDWRLRLTGNVSGTAKIHAPFASGAVHVEGNVQLSDAQLQALPLLDQIATFTRTERFRRMILSKASLVFTRDSGLITAKDIVIESEGLMRVEGACTIINDQIDGLFQVGVTAASLQWLPGSQARVFTISHDGYYWTPLRLTGPVVHPVEDLTPRLAAAAAGQLLQNSQDAVEGAAKTLLDLLPH